MQTPDSSTLPATGASALTASTRTTHSSSPPSSTLSESIKSSIRRKPRTPRKRRPNQTYNAPRLSAVNRSRILQLKADLKTLQKGNSSISEYVSKIKAIADALAYVHAPVSDLELIYATLRGLGDEWINIYTAIHCCSTLPTFSEFHALLLKSNSSDIQTPSSFFAGSSFYNGTGGRISGFSSWKNGDDVKMLRLEFVKPEVISWAPRVIVLHNFLSSEECDYLITNARPRLQRSLLADVKGKPMISNNRTSYGAYLSEKEIKHPFVQAIDRRISVFSQVPIENGEPVHVLRYEKNQYLRLHRDYLSESNTFSLNLGGQRIATMLMYLNDNFEGGETYFPMAGKGKCSCAGKMLKGRSVKPIKGDAVLFWSMGLDGKVDLSSTHAGSDVLSGEKWCATKFLRQKTIIFAAKPKTAIGEPIKSRIIGEPIIMQPKTDIGEPIKSSKIDEPIIMQPKTTEIGEPIKSSKIDEPIIMQPKTDIGEPINSSKIGEPVNMQPKTEIGEPIKSQPKTEINEPIIMQPKTKIGEPIKSRKLGKRTRTDDEPKTEVKSRRCSRCKLTGHYKSTCSAGVEVDANPMGKTPT